MGAGSRRRVFSVTISSVLALLAGGAAGKTVNIGPGDDLPGAIAALSAGDELVLAGGTYSVSSRLSVGVSGAQGSPIVIRGADGATATITRPDANQNTINVDSAQWVELRNLDVTGGSHGIRITDSSHVTIADCHVHDTGDVGISANAPGSDYADLHFVHDQVDHTGGTGEGFYLGCNDDGCRIHDSVIEKNWVHDTKDNVSQGDGIEVKDGSYGNAIRDNVIHDTGYPCIIVYGNAGHGGVNTIERNAMWSCGDHGIQAAADAVIQNNLIFSPASDGIHSQVHQSASPGNLQILHNTVISNNAAYSASGVVGTILLANNALYALGNAINLTGTLTGVTATGNVGVGGVQGVSSGFSATGNAANDFVDVDFTAAHRNAYPKAGSALIAAGDPAHVVADDFDGTDRAGVADVGAYAYKAGGAPAWPVAPGFKDTSAIPASGGAPGAGGAAGTGGADATGAGGASAGGGSGAGASGGNTGGGAGGAAGGSSTGGSGTTGGASGVDGGSAAPGAAKDDGGCGCRVADHTSDANSYAGLVLGAAAFLRRRARKPRSER
ncbi:MAG TPA: right-handed parallel beta-helix repeat-containing protein [Polyangiaceae bacterium]|nr:right-handed parallel beta-helix repeat-containing protein [Polyangiaceae bacterium]